MLNQIKAIKALSYLKSSAIFCATIGGILLAANIELSKFGFIPLAFSSFSMTLAAIIENNRLNAFYSGTLFIGVDLFGVYRWVIVG
jgi:hypothetical protein